MDGPATTVEVCAALEPDASDAQSLHDLVDEAWPLLVDAGLAVPLPTDPMVVATP